VRLVGFIIKKNGKVISKKQHWSRNRLSLENDDDYNDGDD